MTEKRGLSFAIGLLFTLVGLLAGCAKEDTPPKCAVGQLVCDQRCVDPLLDSAHCGECGLTCPGGSSCTLGVCKASDGNIVQAIDTTPPTSCPSGELLCGSLCVRPALDDANCGTCGNVCPVGNVCDQSACRPIGDGCPPGRTLCGDVCVDLTSSASHCGQCDTSCGAGSCLGGVCSCSPLELMCGAECINPAVDPLNCSACGVACATGQVCTSGVCVCPVGQTLCDGACVDLQADPEHCGVCGTACATGQLCDAGACLCPTGLELCATGCVDLQSTASDCGACGIACASDKECSFGSCVCPTGQTECDGACLDLTSDAEHCGGCDVACSGGQVCASSTCQCPEGETLCDGTCADTSTSAEHCGACGTECTGGQVCNASQCECPQEQTLCGDACADTMTDAANCGACGTECTGGQTCQAGSCECPEGQSFCDGECLDTQTDALNCGACGAQCSLGELCSSGTCEGGGLGDDGCQGVAENVTLSRLSLYQTVQIDVMEGGNEIADRNVDVVAGKNALLRVFADVGAGWSTRELSARLFLDDGTERVTLYSDAPQVFSGQSEDADRSSTFEFDVPGELIRASTRYAVELVECGEPPGQMIASPRFPTTGGAELRAVTAGGLRIHIVVLRVGDRLPDTSEAALEAIRQGFLATYPIDSVEITVSEPYDLPDPTAWTSNLVSLRYLRDSERPDPGVYYYGMLMPTENMRDFCGNGCTAGIGYVPYGGGDYAQSGRVSLGLAYGDEESLLTMIHEIGHNHGRNHAPCVPPGAVIEGVDQGFPYDNAAIGVWGYDIRSDSLIEPDHPDVMAYCNEPWLSDYTYGGLLSTVLDVNRVQQSLIVDPARIGEFRVLLVEAGTMRWLGSRPGVVTADGAPVVARVLDSTGAFVTELTVYQNDMADVTAYSVDVPTPQPGWHFLELLGAGRVAF